MLRPRHTVHLGGAVLSTLLLASCASSEPHAPLQLEELQETLVEAEDIGVAGIVQENEWLTEATKLQPGMAQLQEVENNRQCSDAIKRGNSMKIPAIAAASRTFQEGVDQIAVGIYTVSDTESNEVERIYSDILTHCGDNPTNPYSKDEFTISELSSPEPEVTGLVVETRTIWGDATTTVVMQRQIGHHVVTAGAIGFMEPTLAQVFNEQVARLESTLGNDEGLLDRFRNS
ncbi:hypothetical protein QP027_08895 [Corynebacterium breve]|uniref:Lipoprotein n=1 Tax=Corynebacterium breve TaxID=3049799 RepID=A0ABY8VC30_9CORY|nr:hypothetical protein [Corynebacterium breve]WIM67230.1 hypothetical protein QP027_08895 [Corynebacterium breve]